MPSQVLENNSLGEISEGNSSFPFPNQKNVEAHLYSPLSAVIQVVSLLLIIVIGLFGNLYVCAVVYKNRNLRNPTFIFIFNLAVSNIGALLFCTPFPIIVSSQNKFELGEYWCCVSGFLNNLFFCVSIFTLSFITLHKYFSVIRCSVPHCLHMNEQKSKVLILVVWIVCGTLSFLFLGPFDHWSYIAFNVTSAHCGITFPKTVGEKLRLGGLALLAFVVPVLIMSYAYGRIYKKVTAHARRMSHTINTHDHVSPLKRKLAITLCLMFTTFVVCWLPFFLLIALAIGFESSDQLPYSLGRIAYWFGYFNCAINPAIYCLRTSAFKEAGVKGRSSFYQITRVKASRRSRRALSLPSFPSHPDLPKSPRRPRHSEPQLGFNTSKTNSVPQLKQTKELYISTSSFSCASNSGHCNFMKETNNRLSCTTSDTSLTGHNLVAPHTSALAKKWRRSREPSLEPVQESYTINVELTSLDNDSVKKSGI